MTRYILDFGLANAGGAPTFVLYVDGETLGALTPPAISEIGQGVYRFSVDWDALPLVTSITFKATLAGVELADTVSRPSTVGTIPTTPAGTTGNITLEDLRTRARRRADMEGSPFVSDSEWRDYLNAGWGELFDMLVMKFGDEYFEAPPLIYSATGDSDRFTLPNGQGADPGFLKLLAFYYENGPDRWVTMRTFRRAESGRVSGVFRYRLSQSAIWVEPLPPIGQRFKMLYTPRAPKLVLDTDTIDVPNGWDEYVVLEAARRALVKEESDTAAVEREKAGLLARIDLAAANRDAGEPATVVDIYASEDDESIPPVAGLPSGPTDFILDLE